MATDTTDKTPVWPIDVDGEHYKGERYVKGNVFHIEYLKNHYRDFARSNLFKVEFILNNEVTKNFSFLSTDRTERVEMTAKSVNIPAYDMGRQEIKRMGQRIVLPSTMNTGECQMTFISDDNYDQRKFLHSWIKNFSYDYDYNVYRPVMGLVRSTIRIFQLDNQFNIVFGVQLNHAWPTSVGEIQLSQDSENQISEFPTTFAYSTYQIISPEPDKV